MQILRLIQKTSEVSGKLFSFLAAVMIVILCYEVVARYVFTAPTDWAPELVPFLGGIYCVLGGAFTMRCRGHVSVDILFAKLHPKKQAVLSLMTYPVGFCFFIALLDVSYISAIEAIEVFEDSGTTAKTPIWIAKAFLPIGAFLFGLQWTTSVILDFKEAFAKGGAS